MRDVPARLTGHVGVLIFTAIRLPDSDPGKAEGGSLEARDGDVQTASGGTRRPDCEARPGQPCCAECHDLAVGQRPSSDCLSAWSPSAAPRDAATSVANHWDAGRFIDIVPRQD